MKNYFDEIGVKLKKQIEIEELAIVDNSHKHKGHKFFLPNKFHLHLKIKSLYLTSISRVNAHNVSVPVCNQCAMASLHQVRIWKSANCSSVTFPFLRRVSLITLLRTKAVKYLCCSLVDTQEWQLQDLCK